MTKRRGEDGFMLVGLIVAIFIILLVLAVAAPTVAKALRRDQEVEAIRRGNQYVRAIQLYYRKTGQYPGSIDQLEKTNNIRFLRQRYVDPMTGKPDWRLIHVGEAKTTVKGFFGKPLAGLAGGSGIAGTSTPGSTVGGAAPGGAGGAPGAGSSSFGSSSFGGSGGASPGAGTSTGDTSSGTGSSFGGSSPSSGGPTGFGSGSSGAPSTVGAGSSGSASGIGSQSASTFTGGGAPIMGIGSQAPGSSITVLNEQTTYATWEFLYDPRIEQLKANSSPLGGGAGGTPASSFGSGSGSGSGSGFGTPGAGANGTAASGNSFGSPASTTPSPTAPSGTTPPQ